MISQLKVFASPQHFHVAKQWETFELLATYCQAYRVSNMTPTQLDVRALLSLSLSLSLPKLTVALRGPVCGEFRPGPAAAANGAVLGDYEIAGVLSAGWSSAYYIHISIYTYIYTQIPDICIVYIFLYRNHILFGSVADHKLGLNANWKPCQETQPQTPFGIVSI